MRQVYMQGTSLSYHTYEAEKPQLTYSGYIGLNDQRHAPVLIILVSTKQYIHVSTVIYNNRKHGTG